MQKGRVVKPLSPADWLSALPWLLGILAAFMVPYMFRTGGLAGKYVWDEFCLSNLYPMSFFARREFVNGFFPLWSSWNGAGFPLLANIMEEAVHPLSIFKYILPFPGGLNLYYALRLFACLTGCYALARRMRASREGAVLGAALFTLTGFVAMNVNGAIGPVFYMGWFLFAFHRMAMKPSLSSWCLVAAGFALSFLGGNPQYGVYQLFLGAGLYLTVLLAYKPGFSRRTYFLLPATALAMGAVFTLVQTLPFFEYLSRAFTHHIPGYGSLHLDPRGFVGAVSPLFDKAIVLMAGQDAGLSLDKFIELRYTSDTYVNTTVPFPFEYMGMVSVFFLITAIAGLRRLPAEVSFFVLVAVVSMGTAFGVFPFSLIGRIPPFHVFTNFRYPCFTAAMAAAMAGAVFLARLRLPSYKKIVRISLLGLIAVSASGAAVLAAQAGLPLTAPTLLQPAAALVITGAVLVLLVLWGRPWPIVIFAILELLAYDRMLDKPIFPHPLKAWEKDTVVSFVDDDPAFRFVAYDEIIHPNLGVLLDRNDLRNYVVTFPRDHSRWIRAVNDWEKIDVLKYFLNHYYLAPLPSKLDSPLVSKASVRYLLSENRFPPAGFGEENVKILRSVSPGPKYLNTRFAAVNGVTKKGWFQHSPSKVVMEPSKTPPGAQSLRVFAGVEPSAWKTDSKDGVSMTLFTPRESDKEGRLLYSRYMDPRRRRSERRWIDAVLPRYPDEVLAAAVLPGPADDRTADFALWGDFHSPRLRSRFDRTWRLENDGRIKRYKNQKARPRLRFAKDVRVCPGVSECYRRLKDHPSHEIVVDRPGRDWPYGAGEVLQTQWKANRVSAKVRAESPATLVLADIYYPGWRAWTDKKEARIHRLDCSFRAVRVPRGTKEVVFKYVPVTFRIGLWSGLSGGLFFLTLVVMAVRRQRQARK